MTDEEKILAEQKEEQQAPEEEPKKKRYQSQGYYIIKIISGGYICWMAYSLISYKIKTPKAPPLLCYGFGVAFALFGLWILIDNIIGYMKYTKTNRFEDEMIGKKSEDAGLDPDAQSESSKESLFVRREPAPSSLAAIAGYQNPAEEEELPEIGAPAEEDLPEIGAPADASGAEGTEE
ncbi:MAG: hypothetical protein II930_07250 [Lachnospiraceae bacterium]|nr:hypothetical protein [Lachnospiraceae bacterium]